MIKKYSQKRPTNRRTAPPTNFQGPIITSCGSRGVIRTRPSITTTNTLLRVWDMDKVYIMTHPVTDCIDVITWLANLDTTLS